MDASFLRRPTVLATLLFALTFLLYAPALGFEFLNYDDDVYVTANAGVRAGLTPESVRWAFTSGHAANWHPLTWLSHQLDVQLFGLDAGAHHRTNVLLHALTAALALLALNALTRAPVRSAIAAALFALHPLRVESVAWVAERKDLLAGLFFCATLLAWAGAVRHGGRARHGLALLLFALGLMAKPMLVTLPCVLLLLDYWPLDRAPLGPRRLVLEKLPFFALALTSCIVTWAVQRAGGAMELLVPAGERVANAVNTLGLYAWKSLVPSGLAVLHPHPALAAPEDSAWSGTTFLVLAILVVTSIVLLRARRRAPYAAVGWAWYAGMLVPVLGLVQVGSQAWAERYSYLPSIGLGVAVVWGVHALLGPARRRLALGAALVALGALAFASRRQLETWRDSRVLFERALAVEESAVAHANLGQALDMAGEREGAERHYRRALELPPLLVPVRIPLARLLRARARVDEARSQLERAVAEAPDMAPAHAELGRMLSESGDDARALVHLARAWELAPGELAYGNNLAWVLATSPDAARPEEAFVLAQALCEATGNTRPELLETLAAACARLGRFDEAVRWQTLALGHSTARGRAASAQRLSRYRNGQALIKAR